MADSTCAFCVTQGALLYSANTNNPPDASTFYYVPAVKKVTIRFDREEPTKFRHSHSGGSRVNPCQNATVTWYLDILCQLCSADWLWDHISPTDFTTLRWFRWYPNPGGATDQGGSNLTKKWQVQGTVVPSDMEFDNDSDDPTEAQFTVECVTSTITWPSAWTKDVTGGAVE